MLQNHLDPSILILAGMPRSGTSYTASLLKAAGLHIGQNLMAAGHGNDKGFFEDLDIVDLHESMLRAQGIHPVGWTLQEDILVEEGFMDRAKKIIDKNGGSGPWGWKDPRTTLFLDFWAALLPQANFVFIFRAPWEVVDSLYRRGDQIFLSDPTLAIQLWVHYNQRILNFCNRFPARCLLVNVSTIYRHSQVFIEAINQQFATDLIIPTLAIYEKGMLHDDVSRSHRPALIRQYYPQALPLYEQLLDKEINLNQSFNRQRLGELEKTPSGIWAFEDWLQTRRLEMKVNHLQSQLEHQQNLLREAQTLDGSLSNTNFTAGDTEVCFHLKEPIRNRVDENLPILNFPSKGS